MTTEARIHANRVNAQKSTGPNTPQGKALVSQNALKHGLSARHDVITSESQADFDLHRDALLAELHPLSPMESILTDRIVSLSWRLKRADLIQNQTFDAMYEKITSDPLANLGKSFGLKGLGNPQPETSDPPPDLTLGRIAIKDFSNARVLDRLLMYERRIEHSLYKTTLELQRLRLLRNLEPSEPNLEPQDRYLAPGPVPGGSTEPNNTPEPAQNHPNPTPRTQNERRHTTHDIRNTQNKPNVKIGNINISTIRTKAYPKEQRTINNERYPKQSQFKPNPSPKLELCSTLSEVEGPIKPNSPAPPGRNTRYEIRTQTVPPQCVPGFCFQFPVERIIYLPILQNSLPALRLRRSRL